MRRLTDRDHPFHINQVHKALRAMGRDLEVEVTA